jgi:hypothetical protein
MCQYLSALVLENGDIVQSEATDSHEDLILLAGLSDATPRPTFVRVEFTADDLLDIDAYRLKVDQDVTPDWWTTERAEDATARLRRIAEPRILRDVRRAILCGGVYVLAGSATANRVVGARIVQMGDNATVQDVWGNATVQDVRDNATVRDVRDNATVRGVWGNAKVIDDHRKAK